MTQATPPNGTLKERVQSAIDWMRPLVQSDGGDVELVDVSEEGTVQIRFHGACIGCPSLNMTLKSGLERNLKEMIPEIREVVSVNNQSDI